MKTEFEDILKSGTFVGIVEENVDPDKKMRLKVRIPYLHGTKDQIPTENLPWTHTRKKSSTQFKIPDKNKIVNIVFPTGELLFPIFDHEEHLDINLQKKIEDLSDDDYTKFISFCYNYNTQVFISVEDGLNLIHKKSGLQVTDSGDVITRLNGNSSNYYVGDDSASQSAMLGNNFIDFMDQLMQVFPTAYLDGNGIPCTAQPPFLKLIAQYQALKKTFLSNNFYISDNGKVSKNNVDTSRQIGDKYETINETEAINIEIEEMMVEEVKEEIKKEKEKEQINGEKVDEKVNEEDGLLGRKNRDDLQEQVEESIATVTTDVDIDEEEQTDEGTPEDEVSYFNDFYKDDNKTTDVPMENASGPTSDAYWEPEYYIPPAQPTTGTGGVATNGARSGTRTTPKSINSEKEELDLSVLTKPGMMSYFLSYEKCLYSSTAKNLGIENTPDNNDHLKNLVSVTRKYWDIPFKFFKENLGYILVLNSAYRNLEVNNAVGGSKTSQHKSGSALDIVLTRNGKAYPKNERLNNLLFYYLKHKFNYFGQLIWEGNASDGPQWCHISLNNGGKTGQIFPAVGGVIKEPNRETVKILQEYGIWDPTKEDKEYVV